MKNTCNFLDFHVDVASLNRRVLENPGQVVALSEENYRYGVAQIAAALQSGEGHYSVVLLAGPSASGKTTTAYKLREQLRKLGTGAHVVSLIPDGRTALLTMRASMRWILPVYMNVFMISLRKGRRISLFSTLRGSVGKKSAIMLYWGKRIS